MLNDAGLEGWELVTVVPIPSRSDYQLRYIFKRKGIPDNEAQIAAWDERVETLTNDDIA